MTDYLDSANVLFIQSGAGAVTRFTQDKLRECVSVKDFGALGDGADDTTAILAASATGKYVCFSRRASTDLGHRFSGFDEMVLRFMASSSG